MKLSFLQFYTFRENILKNAGLMNRSLKWCQLMVINKIVCINSFKFKYESDSQYFVLSQKNFKWNWSYEFFFLQILKLRIIFKQTLLTSNTCCKLHRSLIFSSTRMDSFVRSNFDKIAQYGNPHALNKRKGEKKEDWQLGYTSMSSREVQMVTFNELTTRSF